MAVANTAADNLFEANPFDKTDSRFQLWQDAERDARERLASFQADHLRQVPPKSAAPESFIEYKVALVVGVFDAWAGPFCSMAAWNNDTEFHEDIFDGVIGGFAERLIEQVTKSALGPYAAALTPLGPSAGQIRAQALVSETRIAILQRRAHWKAEGFRIARQAREASPKAQVQPAAAGNGTPGAAPGRPGRKLGIPIDGAKLKAYRASIKLSGPKTGISQEEFAGKCDVSLATIQNGEAGSTWDKKTLNTVADMLTLLRGVPVTPEDLKKPKN